MPSPMFSLSCSGGLAALPTLASIPMATLLLGPIFTVRVANELTSIKPPSLDAAGAHFGQPDCDDPTCISRRAGTWRLRRACSHFCCIREGANDLRAAKRNGFGQLRAHSASGEAGMDQPLPPLGYHRMSYPSWVRHLRSRCPNTQSANAAPAVHNLAERAAQPASDSAVIARSDDDDVRRPETQKSRLRPSPSSSWFLPWPGRINYLSFFGENLPPDHVGIKRSSISACNPLVLSCLRGAVGQSQNGFVWAKAL
jgi:hypothetical protein